MQQPATELATLFTSKHSPRDSQLAQQIYNSLGELVTSHSFVCLFCLKFCSGHFCLMSKGQLRIQLHVMLSEI
jgi:hypothetical protein